MFQHVLNDKIICKWLQMESNGIWIGKAMKFIELNDYRFHVCFCGVLQQATMDYQMCWISPDKMMWIVTGPLDIGHYLLEFAERDKFFHLVNPPLLWIYWEQIPCWGDPSYFCSPKPQVDPSSTRLANGQVRLAAPLPCLWSLGPAVLAVAHPLFFAILTESHRISSKLQVPGYFCARSFWQWVFHELCVGQA